MSDGDDDDERALLCRTDMSLSSKACIKGDMKDHEVFPRMKEIKAHSNRCLGGRLVCWSAGRS